MQESHTYLYDYFYKTEVFLSISDYGTLLDSEPGYIVYNAPRPPYILNPMPKFDPIHLGGCI